jgi:hypothetical protein
MNPKPSSHAAVTEQQDRPDERPRDVGDHHHPLAVKAIGDQPGDRAKEARDPERQEERCCEP